MFSQRLEELNVALQKCQYTNEKIAISDEKALSLFKQVIQSSQSQTGIIYVIGNGGSAGIASHFSNDLLKALKIPSQTLFDSNISTCLANDIGYENAFSYLLKLLLKKDDALVAISSSGKSPNILKAAEAAIEKGASLITLSGFSEVNPLRKMGCLNFWINESDYGLVETAHFFLLHTIVDLWNKIPLSNSQCEQFIGNTDKLQNQIV